jgi:single-strand selective monofunctional uracil DNA glycosylase
MTETASISDRLVAATQNLSDQVAKLRFTKPVAHVYNPLDYAWPAHEIYLRRFGGSKKRVVFIGMNPGPFGMAQTGVPFGEVAAVRDWMGISAAIGKPSREHPNRPVQGFDCTRSEVSGRRLWGLFAARFGKPEKFFSEHFVVNYCPLLFCEAGGKNFTPDKLPAATQAKLFKACDAHLVELLEILQPKWVVGVGDFAAKRGKIAAERMGLQSGKILHPSPASPAANRGWAEIATRELAALKIW